MRETGTGAQVRNLEEGIQQGQWSNAAYWFAPHGLPACFIVQPRSTRQGLYHHS